MCRLFTVASTLNGCVVGYVVLLILTFYRPVHGFRCKWSNEGCESDDECCSKRCLLAHPGTNSRCSKSALYGPCIFHYQCSKRLQCSAEHYHCCSPYWGSCMKRTDCCDRNHLCVAAKGFIYRRCLLQEVTSAAPPATDIHIDWTMTVLGFLITQLFSIFSNSTFSNAFNITTTPVPLR